MPRRKQSIRLALSIGILVLITLAAFHWTAHPSVTIGEDPLRYTSQCLLQLAFAGCSNGACNLSPSSSSSGISCPPCVGTANSKALDSGSHKRLATVPGPQSKTPDKLACMQWLSAFCTWLLLDCLLPFLYNAFHNLVYPTLLRSVLRMS